MSKHVEEENTTGEKVDYAAIMREQADKVNQKNQRDHDLAEKWTRKPRKEED